MSDTKVLIQHDLEVRWRDLDAYDHVNNASYLTFIEEARIRWFRTLPEPWRTVDAEPVVARIETSFKRPIPYPAHLIVRLTALRVGNTSLAIAHQIVDRRDDSVYADGVTVLVWVSPQSGRPVALPEAVRRAASA
jgi:acyl-CoA thioester hydrolase